jgi:hypothetical protein
MKTFAQQIDTPDPQLRSKLTNEVVSRYAQTSSSSMVSLTTRIERQQLCVLAKAR